MFFLFCVQSEISFWVSTIIKFGSIVIKRVLCHQKVLMYSHGQKKIEWCFKDC